MAEIQRVFSGAPWEKQVGYCRALRHGPHVWVTGTVAIDDDGNPYALGDPEAQAKRCLEIIEKALCELGVEMRHVVRTRMFVTDISNWEAFGRAHGAVFQDQPPTTTMVEVSKFISPEFMIEIEADAYIAD
jgi:enamine deaminase RidA (YjgF/YER057c/UK114 family)